MPAGFPINSVVGLLNNYIPPTGQIKPEGNWEQVWGLHSVGFSPSRSGTLRVRRELKADGDIRLSVFLDKILTGSYVHQVHGEIRCRDDQLNTPVSWSVDQGSYTNMGVLVAGTSFAASGSNAENHIVIKDVSGSRNLPVSGKRTLSWALFDSVQRLPHAAFPPIAFTLIDHYDQLKPEQVLSFRETVNFAIGPAESPGEIIIHGYDQIGWGIVPITYYVDEKKRLLFAIAGIEIYVLEASGPLTAAQFWEDLE